MAKAMKKAASTELAATTDAFGALAGMGMENVGASDLLVPRLTILQALSPQLKRNKAEFIDSAEEGVICDVGLGELFPDGILFIPVFYRKDYIEWAPRSSGKGLVQIHSDPSVLDDCQRDDKNRPIRDNGNYIAETAQFFGINLTAGGRKSYVAMASTQLKKARRWNTYATGEKLSRPDGSSFTPPLFYRSYKLTTGEEENSEGSWYGWKIERGPTLPELAGEEHVDVGAPFQQMLGDCKTFLEGLVSGSIKADTSQLDESGSADSDTIDGEAEVM